jgi:hypothetical protein
LFRLEMRFKTIISYLLLSALILFIIFQGVIIALPAIVGALIEKKLPQIIAESGLAESDLIGSDLVGSGLGFKIEKIGITHTLVTDIKLGKGLSANLAELQYRLDDFKTLQLEKILVYGLTINADLDGNNQLSFNGIKFPKENKKTNPVYLNQTYSNPDNSNSDNSTPDNSNLISFSTLLPGKVVLKNAVLSITTLDQKNKGQEIKGQEIKIPFEVMASIQPQGQKLSLNAKFHPFGQTIKALISGDLKSGIDFIKLEARSFNPEVLSGFLNEFLSESLPDKPMVHLSGPVDIDLLKTRDTDWEFNISRLNLASPDTPGILSKTKIKNFTASVQAKTGTGTGTGTSTGTGKLIAKGGFDLSTSLGPVIGLEFDLKLNQNSSPFFDLNMKNKSKDAISLALGPYLATIDQPNFDFSIKGDNILQAGKFVFDCKNIKAKHEGEALFVKKVLINSKIKGDFSDKGKGIGLDINTDLSQIKLTSKAGQAEFKEVKLSGKIAVTKALQPMVKMDANIKNGKMDSREFKIMASGINARLPFIFPFKKNIKSGSFSIADIVYDKEFRASVRGKITQSQPASQPASQSVNQSLNQPLNQAINQTTNQPVTQSLGKSLGIKVSGQGTMPDFEGFQLNFEGEAGVDKQPSARIDFNTDFFSLKPGNMGKLMPDFSISQDSFLRFSSKGTIAYKDHDLDTQASIIIDDGRLSLPDMDLLINGIAGGIDFNDLIVAESLPGQVLTIERIQARQFQFDNAKLKFSIEDGKSLNIENLRFNWCNGIVSTESVRLPARDDILSVILYCDRLELSQILQQMGAFHAEGEGSVNGRIPVVYSNGNISFDNGFLFSTPGSGGRVVIDNTEKIIAGIPMDTPEFAQLDLAREALKDFDYTWAKLELNTFEDTLKVKMQLDGKPAKLLPFEYKKDIGSFVRVDASSPGSRFQGIKMDVNLKLPFNQVMKFGNIIKTIFK